jgi:ClpP class serine protease
MNAQYTSTASTETAEETAEEIEAQRQALAERVASGTRSRPQAVRVETVARQDHANIVNLIHDLTNERTQLNESVKAKRADINEQIAVARQTEVTLGKVVAVFDRAAATPDDIDQLLGLEEDDS